MTGLVQAGVQLVPGKTFGWPKFPRFRCHSVKEKIYGVYTKATVAFCLEQPSLRAALRSRESSSVLGAQQSPRARPALPPAAPQHLSNAGGTKGAQHPHARDVCPRGQRILRPPRRTERSAVTAGIPLTCALAVRARGGGAEAAQRQDRLEAASYLTGYRSRSASVTRAGSFIMSLGPNPCAGAWPAVLTSDARRG